jgi:plastocyanin
MRKERAMRIVSSQWNPDGATAEMTQRMQSDQPTRRDLLRLVGGIGLATAGTFALGHRTVSAQEGGTPVAAATPQIGAQADGTSLWKVAVGGVDMENAIEYHGFFPGEITINAGDSIWFARSHMPMFHTVTFPPDGQAPPLFIPDPEAPVSATPAAGPPKLILNPAIATGTGGTSVDGSQLVSTSVDAFSDPAAQWIFTFPTAGTFDYFCVPHASVMFAKVIVQEAGAALPMDQAAYDAASAEQMAALREQGLAEIEKYSTATSTDQADGTKLWDVTAGAGGATQVRIQRFLPDALEIGAGDTIKFVHRSEGEPHTVTLIGEGEEPPEDILIEQFADGSPKLVQNMLSFLPSGGNVWNGTGFLHSGFMGIPQLGLPTEIEVTFDTPGDYIPYCLLHGDAQGEGMAMKLTVSPA